MIDEKFEQAVTEKKYGAVIMAGSDSDDRGKINPHTGKEEKSHIEKIAESLDAYKIPYKVRICSAHKQPEKLMEIMKEYDSIDAALAIIAVAGGTDALSGTVSFHSYYPVISCPSPSKADNPHNESCLNNPPGSSNAYIREPANVGKFVAQMFSHLDFELVTKLGTKMDEKEEKLKAEDQKIQQKYAIRQGRE